MAWQLIYTSAPSGLVPGRTGFCTVARHPDLRDRLVVELESLSSSYYRPQPGTGSHPHNPVISSHRILDVGGTRYHVLSKIRDASPDYSGRTNHIAHHLVCEEGEVLQAVSPAQILRWFPWRSRWDDPPRYLDEKVDLSNIGRAVQMPATAWARIRKAEDAVLLVESNALAGCFVVCAEGEEEKLLPLFDESLHLLDPNRQSPHKLWQVRFTTFVHAAENTTGVDWRGCWAGNLADQAAERTGALRFDLTRPNSLPAPRDRQLIEVALGVVTERKKTGRIVIRAGPQAVTAAPVIPSEPSHSQYGKRPKAPGPSNRFTPEQIQRLEEEEGKRKKRKKKLLLALGLVGLFLGVLVATMLVLWLRERVSEHASEITSEISRTDAPPEPPTPSAPTSPETKSENEKMRTTAPPHATDSLPAGKPPEKSPASAPPPDEELEMIPRVPTYFVIADMKQGIEIASLFSQQGIVTRTLVDTNLICKARYTNGTFPEFPNPARNGEKAFWNRAGSDFKFYSMSNEPMLKVDESLKKLRLDESVPEPLHVAISFGGTGVSEFQIVLMDQTVIAKSSSVFPPIDMSIRFTSRESDKQRLSLDDGLHNRLKKAFPNENCKIRLSAGNVSSNQEKALVVDLLGIRKALDAEIKGEEARISQLKEERDKSRRAKLNALQRITQAEALRTAGGEVLKESGIIIDRNQDGGLLEFKSDGSKEKPVDLWVEYITYIRKIVERVIKDLELGEKAKQEIMNLLQEAVTNPEQLRKVSEKTSYHFTFLNRDAQNRLKGQFDGCKGMWEKIFSKDVLMEVHAHIQPPPSNSQVVGLEAKLNEAKSKLATMPQSIDQLGEIRVEAVVQNHVLPLVRFSHDTR